MSEKSQNKDSKQTEFNFPISSQEVSPANRSRSQANKKEQVTTDISGLKCFELSKSLPRGGLLERMSKALLTSKTAWSSRLCALTWKEKVTKSGRSIFQLQASVPRTDAKDSGLWRTPDAHCDRGPSSEKRMKMKLEKGMPISINDQVAYRGDRGSLNPTWVEWLMGYPEGYTDLKDWEILSSRKSRKKSAKQLSKRRD